MTSRSLTLTQSDLIFTDFDGTITLIDTGLAMINALSEQAQAEAWDLEYQWRRGEIDSMICLQAQWGLWNRPATEMFALIDGLEMDERFFDFLALVRSRHAGLAIVSDGLQFYLDRMMSARGIETCGDDHCARSADCILRFSNPATVTEAGVSIEFPHRDECGQCGNCKVSHLFRLRRDFARTIYIGDGHSDLCAARYAEIIFAKDALAEDCARAGRSFYPFETFDDILAIVT
ncbi:MAG: HAD-IB family phosphatase [Armatimonadota bacterium]